MEKDLYQILGLTPQASAPEIRKAFLKLAKKYHPDVNPGNKAAEQQFKEINFAYEVLKDSSKRAQYDQMRNAPRHARGPSGFGNPPPMGGFDFGQMGLGDLFEEIFGTPWTRRNADVDAPGSGADRQASLEIGFIDAARGCQKLIELENGKRLTVQIPAGVHEGSKIRLTGQGETGRRGQGDLVITLSVKSHPTFTKDADNILCELPISFSEAVLGAEIEVPTLDGTAYVKVPRGISSGQKLKLPGKGIRSSQGIGDQVVTILIKLPKTIDSHYIEAAQQLSERSPFSPRS